MVRTYILLAALLASPSAPAQQRDDAGQVTAVMPATRVFRVQAGRLTPEEATRGKLLAWGDVVRTEASGRARLLLQDGSILTLGSGSSLRVVQHDPQSQQTRLELGYGRIRCRVASLTAPQSSFQLRTPTAVAGVIGTDFGADSSQPGETRFLCLSGSVRISSSDPDIHGHVDCAPGMTVVVRAGQPPSAPEPATPKQLQRWEHITEPGDPTFALSLPPLTAEQALGVAPPSRDFPWLAQTSAIQPVRWQGLNVSGSLRVRTEAWNWFDDGGPFDGTYGFTHSMLRLGVGQSLGHLQWHLELAQPAIFALPQNAIAPPPQGQLGLGATYSAANDGSRHAAYVFPGRAWVRFRGLAGGDRNQLTLGRFAFVDGAETTPPSRPLDWLKRVRLAHRLLGDFGFSAVGRSQDGVHLAWQAGPAHLTFAGARPTRGVFQVDGLGSLDILWGYGALTTPTLAGNSSGELRLFALGYEDARLVTKADNRPLAVREGADRSANLRLGTFGAHYIHALPTERAGIFDLLFWGVLQSGDWGLERHRAGALALEAGWQPPSTPLRPWLRLGYFAGSGDGDPADGAHRTFFPVLPTPRLHARYPFYNAQNSTDTHAMLLLRPHPQLTLRSEAHVLHLTSRHDLWYSGGGAYSRSLFGYAGRPSGGFRRLASVWDLSADYRLSPRWSLGLYYAHAWGGSVIRNLYPQRPNSHYGYVELNTQF